MTARTLAVTVTLGLFARGALAQTAGLQPGDRVAVCGDSITEQHYYSADIEAYLVACRPTPGVTVEQFGWGGETARGFAQKMPRFMLPFGNTVATTCYGMNDGRYAPLTPDVAASYRASQTAVVEALKRAGVHLIVLGSPGAVDSYTFRHDEKGSHPERAAMYNQTLAALGEIDRDVAKEQGVTFADVHGAMVDAMGKFKAEHGPSAVFAGPDGVHPGPNGHLVMAYAFLKALGVSGDVGTITFDGATKQATATDGHTVRSVAGGAIEMESDRYPFCFTGDPAQAGGTADMARFVPFDDDLNRFRLVAKNVGSDRVRVTFGPASREYAAADLARGVNLAADFRDNPFSGPFAHLMAAVQVKQGVETALDKNFYVNIPTLSADLPEAKAAYEQTEAPIRDCLAGQAKGVAASVKPVRYTIRIEPVSPR